MKERSIRSVIEFLQKESKNKNPDPKGIHDGQKEYNLQLSSKKAENVRLRLIEEGIDPKRLEFIGYLIQNHYTPMKLLRVDQKIDV